MQNPPGESDKEADSEERQLATRAKKKRRPKSKGGIPKVFLGYIPPETLKEQLLFVTNTLQVYRQIDTVALFTKFGPISVTNRMTTKAGGNNFVIASESTINLQFASVSHPQNGGEFNECRYGTDWSQRQ